MEVAAMAVNKVMVIGNLGANPGGACSGFRAERGQFLAGDDRAFHACIDTNLSLASNTGICK
jgi:hypothetical protein